MITQRTKRRRGFTIVELLVSMALVMLIMAVLSEAFAKGLEAFRTLKSIGDMQERLRVAGTALRRDLALRHFEGDRRISDFNPYWVDPNIGNGDQNPNSRAVGGRPAQGFFRIQQPNPVYFEDYDSDGMPSYVVNGAVGNLLPGMPPGPVLHFTSKLVPERKDALRLDQLFSTPVPAGKLDLYEGPPDFRQSGQMNSTWAEIAWFLQPSIDPLTGTQQFAGSTPRWSLYRRARLMIAPRVDTVYVGVSPQTALAQYFGVSCEADPGNYPAAPTQILFNNEYDVAEQPYPNRAVKRSMNYQPVVGGVPAPLQSLNQWYSAPLPVGTSIPPGSPVQEPANLQTDDLVISDVISFEVKVLRPGDTDFRDLNDPAFTIGGVPAYNDPITGISGVYDTATTQWNWLRLSAIKITIRIWDYQTQQARQISIIQDF